MRLLCAHIENFRCLRDISGELGGNARHALGIAFLFGLMDVSGIKTFSVIDAPLAYLDREPGRAALRQAGQSNAQLVLLMSSGEIDGRAPAR